MKIAYVLFASALVALVLVSPAAGYIKAPPKTLGSVCLESDHVCVLKVEKVDAEKGVIQFQHVGQLKGKSDGAVVKHLIKPVLDDGTGRANGKPAKIILDGATEGKLAVMFYFTGPNSRGHVYIDGYWYWVVGVSEKPTNWVAAGGEPMQLTTYSGTAEKLQIAVEKILKGEEVTVPVMVGDARELLQRSAKIQDVRASLKIVGADTLERLANRSDGKKPAPGAKPEPGDKKAVSTPSLVGTVKSVAADGKGFTLVLPPTEKRKEPRDISIQLTERTRITDGKLTVGQTVSVWTEKQDAKAAATVRIDRPTAKP